MLIWKNYQDGMIKRFLIYRKLGWQEIIGSVTLENHGELVKWPESAMIFSSSDRIPDLCSFDVDLKGKAF